MKFNEIEEIQQTHWPLVNQFTDEKECSVCHELWPCTVIQLCDMLVAGAEVKIWTDEAGVIHARQEGDIPVKIIMFGVK